MLNLAKYWNSLYIAEAEVNLILNIFLVDLVNEKDRESNAFKLLESELRAEVTGKLNSYTIIQ